MEAKKSNLQLNILNPKGIECKTASFIGAITEDDPSGTYKGHIGTSGELDDVGDIILEGGFKQTALKGLSNFFFALDHTWGISNEIGIVTLAQEDSKGLYIEGVFHDTQDAQDARKKMLKRLKYGKPVKTSIGYAPTKQPFYLYPNQYSRELPKYLKPEHLQTGLAKAARFDRIRILPEVEVFEGSGVQIPANPSAQLTSVKSLEGTEVTTSVGTDANTMSKETTEQKGYFESAVAETETYQNLWTTFSALEKAIQELRKDCDEGECANADAALKNILNGFARTIYFKIYPLLAALAESEMDEAKCAALDSHLSILLQLKQGLIGNLRNETHFAAVQAAVAEYLGLGDVLLQEVKKHVTRQEGIIQKRLANPENEGKAGRTISNATNGRLMAHCEKIDAMIEHLQSMKDDLVSLANIGRENMPDTEGPKAGMSGMPEVMDDAKENTSTFAAEAKGQPGQDGPGDAPEEKADTSEVKSNESDTTVTHESATTRESAMMREGDAYVPDQSSTEEKSAITSESQESPDTSAASVERERKAKQKQLEWRIRLLNLGL